MELQCIGLSGCSQDSNRTAQEPSQFEKRGSFCRICLGTAVTNQCTSDLSAFTFPQTILYHENYFIDGENRRIHPNVFYLLTLLSLHPHNSTQDPQPKSNKLLHPSHHTTLCIFRRGPNSPIDLSLSPIPSQANSAVAISLFSIHHGRSGLCFFGIRVRLKCNHTVPKIVFLHHSAESTYMFRRTLFLTRT